MVLPLPQALFWVVGQWSAMKTRQVLWVWGTPGIQTKHLLLLPLQFSLETPHFRLSNEEIHSDFLVE